MKVTILDRIVYVLGRGVLELAARVPERLGYGAAAALGRLFFRCSPRRQRAALDFLRHAYPDRPAGELLQLARIATGNIFKVPLDMARLTRLLARGGKLSSVCDSRELVPFLPKGQFLLLAAHIGSWEMGAVGVADLVGGAHGIARTFRNPLLQRWILANRQRCGLIVHPRRGGVRQLAKAVRAGATGLQVVDQHQRLRGVMAPFFGEVCACERAAVSMALRQQIPLQVAVCLRVGPGFRFRMVGSPSFVPTVTGDKVRDLEQAVMEVNRRLEQHILATPDQYLWIHERYRARPADAAAATDAAAAGDDDAGEDD